MQLGRSDSSWISYFIACMGGCLGCCSKNPLITTDPQRGLYGQGQAEDFWSTSTCDMDISAIQSYRSASSINTSNLNLDQHSGVGSTSNPNQFLNHGLILWNKQRNQWTGSKKSQRNQSRDPRLSWNATYESLLGTSKAFPERISLSEMVEFLVDIWEQEGLYE